MSRNNFIVIAIEIICLVYFSFESEWKVQFKMFILFAQILCLFVLINAAEVYGNFPKTHGCFTPVLSLLIKKTFFVIPAQNEQQFQKAATAPGHIDYNNLKNQIVAKIFSEYDPKRLKSITDTLGCKTLDCPQLLSASNIQYNILETAGKHFIGRGERQNKLIIHSTNTEISNTSPVQQNVSTVSYKLDCIRNLEITITKTTQIKSERKIGIGFLSFSKTKIDTKTEVTRTGETQEHTVYYPSQNITVEPFSKMNVTFNFYRHEDINNYLLDFQIANNSIFSHLDVVDNVLVFAKKPLGDFLQKHVKFISTLKYDDDMMLKLIEKDGKFILKNFPASEKITNFGVDVIFGKATSLPKF